MGGAQSARQDRNSPEEPALAAREPFDSATQAPVAPISQIETISTEDKKEDTSEEVKRCPCLRNELLHPEWRTFIPERLSLIPKF